MNFIQNLIRNSNRIQFNPSSFRQNSLVRSASVAIILRLSPRENSVASSLTSVSSRFNLFQCICEQDKIHKFECISGFLKSNEQRLKTGSGSGLQLLYAKRYRSGELCFPGGKIEPGESIVEAAERETREEVDIDLTKGFSLIAQLDEKQTFDKLNVYNLVYLQLNKESPPIKLSENELTDYQWIDLDEFLFEDSDYRKIEKMPLSRISQSRRLRNPLLKFICDQVNVPYIQLPKSPLGNEFRLWGLTLDITSDLVKRMRNDQKSFLELSKSYNRHILFYLYRYFPYSILALILPIATIIYFLIKFLF